MPHIYMYILYNDNNCNSATATILCGIWVASAFFLSPLKQNCSTKNEAKAQLKREKKKMLNACMRCTLYMSI